METGGENNRSNQGSALGETPSQPRLQNLDNAQINMQGNNKIETKDIESDGKDGDLKVSRLSANEAKLGKVESDGMALNTKQSTPEQLDGQKRMNLHVAASAIDKVANVITEKDHISVLPGQEPSQNTKKGHGLGARTATGLALGDSRMLLNNDAQDVTINKSDRNHEDMSLTSTSSSQQKIDSSYQDNAKTQISNILNKQGKNIDTDKLIQELSKTTGKSTNDIKKILSDQSKENKVITGGQETKNTKTVNVTEPTTYYQRNVIADNNVRGKSNDKLELKEKKQEPEKHKEIESESKGKGKNIPPALLEDNDTDEK